MLQMRSLKVVPLLVLVAGIAAGQAPVINNVFNAASNVVQGLPNSGLAQGSIFVVQGDNMGPVTLDTATAPFQSPNLDGTTVSVMVGSTTVNALMYYTSAGQVAALLPSNTPTGSGTLTVTYQGNASSTFTVNVVQNNIGLFTIPQNGQGAAIATYPDYSLVSAEPGTGAPGSPADTCPASGQPNCVGADTYTGAALPGDVITLWATGLGPVSGSDASGAGLGQAINTPLTLWIGGVQVPSSNVSYQGRSGCCIGEDQIQFTMPSNTPTGCAVPVVLQLGTLLSNTTLMPIGTSSRSCTPSNAAFTGAMVSALTTATGPITLGTVQLGRQIAAVNSSGVFYQDYGIAAFGQYSVNYNQQSTLPTVVTSLDSPPVGTCIAFPANSSTGPNPALLTALGGADPGSLSVTGPGGAPLAMTDKGGTPQTYEAVFSATGTYFSGGQYTFSASGGRDISKFSTGFDIVAPAPTWPNPNQASLLTSGVTRANGLTITWTPGSAAANYNVYLSGVSFTATATASPGAAFQCIVPASAGTFTIPPSVLLALPSGGYAEVDFKPALLPGSFTAPGLNLGFLSFSYQTSVFPAFN